jgi:flagellar protein FlaG
MDIQSISSQPTGNVQVFDRPTTTQVSKTAAPQSSNPVTPTQEAQQAPNRERINKAVESINKTIQATAQNVEFNVDSDLGKVIVTVIDRSTKQVLRQIPTVEVLEIAKSLDKLQGLIIKQAV